MTEHVEKETNVTRGFEAIIPRGLTFRAKKKYGLGRMRGGVNPHGGLKTPSGVDYKLGVNSTFGGDTCSCLVAKRAGSILWSGLE